MKERLGLGTICVKLLDRLFEFKRKALNIVETGTLRDREMEPGWDTEERSTIAIARWMEMCRNRTGVNHSFCSVDSDKGNLTISSDVIAYAGLDRFVEYHQSDAATWFMEQRVTQRPLWDFVLLDSDSDERVILREYTAIEGVMSVNSMIVIDDVYNRGTINKGKLAVPVAHSRGRMHFRVGDTEVIGHGEAGLIAERYARETGYA